jgi:amino acid adenylation domain-containing protein
MDSQTYTPVEYWLNYLKDVNSLNFPVIIESKLPGTVSVEIGIEKEQMYAILESAGKKDLNVLKLFIGAMGIVISRYACQKDVVIAMPPLNLPETEIGNCGTLYCRLEPDDTLLVSEYFTRIHKSVNDAYLNCEYDEQLFRESFVKRNASSLSLLNGVGFNYHRLHAKGTWVDDQQLLFELITGDVDFIRITSRYSHMPKQLVKNMGESLLFLILNFPKNKTGFISDCKMVSPNKLESWIRQFENNKRNYDTTVTVVDLFLKQVNRCPSKIAIQNGSTLLTYNELDQLSGRISNYIAELTKNCKANIVGVMMTCSYMQVGVLLGILRSGAAYLPLGTDYPEDRIVEISRNAGCTIIFTDSKDSLLEIKGCKVIPVDSIPPASAIHSDYLPNPNDLAYIIHSSGTTGNAKGIMIEHRSIVNLLFWYNENYAINENTRIIQVTNIVIDIAFQEVFSALINGLTLYIPHEEERRNKQLFIDYLNKNKINFIQLIPDLLTEYLLDQPKLEFLDQILCGGDVLNDSLKDDIVEKGYRLYNIYGQTETTIDTVGAICEYAVPARFNQFVANYDMLIVDEHGNLCPEFLTGEIITGGVGVARGYLNQPELTAEKFVSHPFKNGVRMYRTGDLARRFSDGSIEFLGRKDDQVKIRGFRIEPRAIELALECHANVDVAVVVALHSDDEKELIAYYTSNKTSAESDLRSFLVLRLPAYMIPRHFVKLDKFPLTSVGKIDRKALPEPTVGMANNYIAPTGSLEKKLVEIWAEVLKLDPSLISVDSNFFELGGHSLKVTRVISAIEKEFNVRIQLTTFFMKPTIIELEENILMDSLSRKIPNTGNKITL